MKTFVVALALAVLAPAVAGAQPLEQNFAFGAPLGVLGNDRIRASRTVGPQAAPRPARRTGDVAVRLGDRHRPSRYPRWN